MVHWCAAFAARIADLRRAVHAWKYTAGFHAFVEHHTNHLVLWECFGMPAEGQIDAAAHGLL